MTFEIGQWVRLSDGRIGRIESFLNDGSPFVGIHGGGMIAGMPSLPLRAPGEFKVGDRVSSGVNIGTVSELKKDGFYTPEMGRYTTEYAANHVKLITPVEVTAAQPVESFPRPIKRKDVRVGDVVSWDRHPFTIVEVQSVEIGRFLHSEGVMHTDEKYDRSHPLTLHSRKGECDAQDAPTNYDNAHNNNTQKATATTGNAPVCRGDIPTKPIPEGFRKVSLGGTVCIIPKAEWKYKPKQPEEKSPEEIGFEGCDGYVFRVDAKNPYYLFAGIDKNECDAGDRTHESLDIRIRKHLEARGK